MTAEEKAIITDIKKCNFKEIDAHFKAESEKRKSRTKDQKLVSVDICVLFLFDFHFN